MTSRILALTAVVLTAAANLHAAPTNVWSGGGADDNWSTADNWTNGAPGAFAAGLLFAGTNRLATTNNVVVEAFLLDHDATAGTFVHGGDAVTFVEEAGVAPVIRNGSANAQTINFNVSNGNAGDGTLTVDAAAGPLAFGGAVSAAGGARTLVITGSGEVTFGGAVQDGAGAALTVIKRGTGTGILSVASGYTGPTVVEDGVLAAAGALATPSITASGGVFAAAADNILPDAAPVHVASGAFAALGNDSIGLLSAAGGTVYLASGKVLTASFAGTGLVAAALQGGGSLAKTGAGVLELSATGSVLNTLRVGAGATGGEVALAGGSIAGTGPMPRFIVGSGAAGSGILTVRDGTHVFGGDGYASSGDIGESGGAGALTIENGSLSVATSGGTPASLRLGCNGTANGTLTVNGGALNVPGRILMAANNAGAVGTLTLNGGEVNLGDGGGGVFDPGRGRLWMGAGLGTARLNGGTLTLFDFAGGSTNARIYLNGATVKPVTNNTAFVNGTFAFLVSSNGAIFDTAGWNITVGSALAHDAALGADPDGGLAKFGAGTLTLTGGNAYSNDTVVHAGTLALAGGGTPGAHNTAPVRVGLGAALFFQRSDTFGSHIAATIKPIVVEQGGLITNGNVFNQLGPVTLAGGRIESGGGAGVFGFQSFGLTRTRSGRIFDALKGCG